MGAFLPSQGSLMTQQSPFEDIDPTETQDWLDSIDSVMRARGPQRAHFLLEKLVDFTRRSGAYLPFKPNTAYLNTISRAQQPDYPGDRSLERRNEAYMRWNALAMVVQANRKSSEYGGHIASYASAATLYEVGFNHFWRAKSAAHPGDMVFMQGHSSPGIYARAYLEGRLDEEQLLRFRQEVRGDGLSSYPHPWLMPDFWQFPTVSMGLGPMMAIFQARFVRYLEHRGIVPASDRRVWAFLGDGEMDEPESMGALTMPVREKLDNLIFVINCNLQRLDGPVRGNGKIIQELEAAFLGAGWNVIKVLWGSRWDPLLERDHEGLLKRLMEECVDGEYQNFKSKGGAYTREHFFGKYPELKEMVANMSDEEIWRLNRGGHDPVKVYAAYAAAVANKGAPTVILAKTVKGFGLGKSAEGLNVAHQQKKLGEEDLRVMRDRFNIPISDEEIAGLTFRKPGPDSEEMKYLLERRAELGGYLPARHSASPQLQVPPLETFSALLEGKISPTTETTGRFTPGRVAYPASVAELREIVRGAKKLRVMGARHSWSKGIVTDGTLVSLDRLDRIVDVDESATPVRATVQAGIRLKALIAGLEARGLALSNLGSIAEQSLAGALATGTHGTGLGFQCLASQVESLKLIDGRGDERTIDRTDEAFPAAAVGLGCLGVVHEVTLAVVPCFQMHAITETMRFEDVVADLDGLVRGHDHFKLWWCVPGERAIVFKNERTSAPRNDSDLMRWFKDDFLSVIVYRALVALGEALAQAAHPANQPVPHRRRR